MLRLVELFHPTERTPATRHARWDEEATTQEDLERRISNVDIEFGGRLDVLFIHDAPAQVRHRFRGAVRMALRSRACVRVVPTLTCLVDHACREVGSDDR